MAEILSVCNLDYFIMLFYKYLFGYCSKESFCGFCFYFGVLVSGLCKLKKARLILLIL